MPKNRRRRRKEQGDGNRTKPCGGRRSSKRSIFLSSVVQKFEMKTVFVLYVLRERERRCEGEVREQEGERLKVKKKEKKSERIKKKFLI